MIDVNSLPLAALLAAMAKGGPANASKVTIEVDLAAGTAKVSAEGDTIDDAGEVVPLEAKSVDVSADELAAELDMVHEKAEGDSKEEPPASDKPADAAPPEAA